MFENILILATIPASHVSGFILHPKFFWLPKYAFINAFFGLFIAPLLTSISLELYVEYTFGLVLSFLFGTVPFFLFDNAVALCGEQFAFIFAIIVFYYYIVLFITIYLVFYEAVSPSKKQQLASMTPSERLEHDRQVEKYVRNHPNSFVNDASPTDPNDEMLVFGLTNLDEINTATVQANEIAKALRKNN